MFPNPSNTQPKLSASFCKAEEKEGNKLCNIYMPILSFFFPLKKEKEFIIFLFPHLLEMVNCKVFHQCLKLDYCINIYVRQNSILGIKSSKGLQEHYLTFKVLTVTFWTEPSAVICGSLSLEEKENCCTWQLRTAAHDK